MELLILPTVLVRARTFPPYVEGFEFQFLEDVAVEYSSFSLFNAKAIGVYGYEGDGTLFHNAVVLYGILERHGRPHRGIKCLSQRVVEVSFVIIVRSG